MLHLQLGLYIYIYICKYFEMEYEDEIAGFVVAHKSHEKPKTVNHFWWKKFTNYIYNIKGVSLRGVLCWHCERQLVLEAVWLGRAFLWCQLWRSLQQHLWTQWLCVSLLMLCFGEHVSFSVFGFQFPFEWDKSKSFLAVKITFDLYIYAKIRSAGVQR